MTEPLVIATLALVGATLALAVTAVLQWRTLERHARHLQQSVSVARDAGNAAQASADAARQAIVLTHRPKLIVRAIRIPELGQVLSGHTHLSAPPQNLSLAFHIVNIGGTPARLIGIDTGFTLGAELATYPEYYDGQPSENPNVTFGPGEVHNVFGAPTEVTAAQIHAIMNHQAFYVVALLTYRDDLGQNRHTGVGRRYEYQQSRFVPIDNPDYEYAD